MERNIYFPKNYVAWRTVVRNVIMLSAEAEEVPATYRVSVKPIDVNDKGAANNEKEIGYYLRDFVGNTYRIIDTAAETIDVSDDFRTGYGPQSGRQGVIYNSSGDGFSPYLTPARQYALDKSSIDASQKMEKDILWRYANIVNVRWHAEGVVFSHKESGEQEYVKFTDGKIVLRNWHKLIEEEINPGDADPTPIHRSWNVVGEEIEITETTHYYLYAVVPIDKDEHSAIILISTRFYRERAFSGHITVLTGILNSKENNRTFSMLWGNVDTTRPEPIITQEEHGFTAGTPIRNNGTTYIKAQADNDINAQVCGIVSEVINENQFRYVSDGFIPGDWIKGAEYFLCPYEAGKMIILPDPEVWEVGQVRMSLGFGTTKGFKVEIDVGDVIDELPTVRLVGVWDREFEFCFNAGVEEILTIDLWAVYEYQIVEAILECDGVIQVSINNNGVPVGGLENITVGAIASTQATINSIVAVGSRVTLRIAPTFSGDPNIIKGKLKILRS